LNELVTKGNLMSYHHFTIDERESILIYCTQGLNFLSEVFITDSLLHKIMKFPKCYILYA